jgi:hypothetical protein
MSDKDDFFGGFANIAGEISPHAEGGPMDIEDDGRITDTSQSSVMTVDPEEILADDDLTELGSEEEESTEKPTDTGDEEGAQEEELEEVEEEVEEEIEPEEEPEAKPKPKKKVEEIEPEVEGEEGAEDLGEIEADISMYFTEKLAEALGVDVEEEDKFDSANDVVDFMRQLVEENSKPDFANDDVEKMNQFVADGGDLKEYFKTSYGELDIDSIDMASETSQKAVIKEFLKTENYSDARINKRLERYEEAGTLEEEAEDAKELLSEYKQRESQKLLDAQEKLASTRQEQQQKLITDVQSNIKALKNVRGIPVSEGEKKQLLNYVFNPDTDGLTQYQKDYSKDINNLIESAYFTMKGDALVQKMQNKATSKAARTIKAKLESKGKRTKSARGQEETSDLDMLVQASKFLRKR